MRLESLRPKGRAAEHFSSASLVLGVGVFSGPCCRCYASAWDQDSPSFDKVDLRKKHAELAEGGHLKNGTHASKCALDHPNCRNRT